MSGPHASGVSRRVGPLSALASLVALTTVLASSAGPAAAAATGPLVQNRQYGFTFRLPMGWYALPLGEAAKPKLGPLATSGKAAADLAPLLRQELEQRAVSQHVVVMALGRTPRSTTASLDVQVVPSALPTGVPIGAVTSILQSSIGSEAKVRKVQQLHLGGAGQGYRVDLALNLSPTSSVTEVEELIPHDRRTYVVIFAGTDPDPVMATWHWTR